MEFEDIIKLDSLEGFSAISDDVIATALKGASPQLQGHIFEKLSDERSHDIRAEMESMGAVCISWVEDAQGRILEGLGV